MSNLPKSHIILMRSYLFDCARYYWVFGGVKMFIDNVLMDRLLLVGQMCIFSPTAVLMGVRNKKIKAVECFLLPYGM